LRISQHPSRNPTTTAILRKPIKPDYTKASAYRPIALENKLGKLIESVVTVSHICMSRKSTSASGRTKGKWSGVGIIDEVAQRQFG
jgi:hypothetical protein